MYDACVLRGVSGVCTRGLLVACGFCSEGFVFSVAGGWGGWKEHTHTAKLVEWFLVPKTLIMAAAAAAAPRGAVDIDVVLRFRGEREGGHEATQKPSSPPSVSSRLFLWLFSSINTKQRRRALCNNLCGGGLSWGVFCFPNHRQLLLPEVGRKDWTTRPSTMPSRMQ